MARRSPDEDVPPREEGDAARLLDNKSDNGQYKRKITQRLANQKSIVTTLVTWESQLWCEGQQRRRGHGAARRTSASKGLYGSGLNFVQNMTIIAHTRWNRYGWQPRRFDEGWQNLH